MTEVSGSDSDDQMVPVWATVGEYGQPDRREVIRIPMWKARELNAEIAWKEEPAGDEQAA